MTHYFAGNPTWFFWQALRIATYKMIIFLLMVWLLHNQLKKFLSQIVFDRAERGNKGKHSIKQSHI